MSDKLRAAQYVRMSTEHQNYSIEYQGAANAAYARERSYEIIRTFADPGVSGLTYAKREGLKALLAAVVGGQADFEVVLVYDVSRWGRFQDTDEGAHYEFVCRQAGVRIEYTAEPFANDGSVVTSLVKHLKRAMAAEYSRELSEKVSRAKRGLGAKGYFQGGPAGYGLRRMSLGRDGVPGRVMEAGERNGVAGGRVTLVPGPEDEVEIIRWIFAMRAERLSMRAIADWLNAEAIPGPTRGAWDWSTIKCILRNEKYAGVKVTGRARVRLGVVTREPESKWLRKPGAFAPIVSQQAFDAAQIWHSRKWGPVSEDALVSALRTVLADRGRLSAKIIREDARAPSPTAYVAWFGSLEKAYKRVGYEPDRQQRLAMERIRVHKPHLARGAKSLGSRFDD